MKLLAGILLLAVVLAGCSAPAKPPTVKEPPKSTAIDAPWWPIGTYWDVTIERPGGESQSGRPAHERDSYRLVNFWNDSSTAHFWLGIADRDLALDHALFDTNPFLGRIHYEILAPHEKGMHAGMYSFPLEDEKRWNAFLLSGQWHLIADATNVTGKRGPERGVAITGSGDRGNTIEFNYVPSAQWFTRLAIEEPSGASLLTATVTDYGTGAQGTYYFLRGVDLYVGPTTTLRAGTHQEAFTLDESAEASSVAIWIDARTTGPATIQIVDPAGTVRYEKTITSPTGGSVTEKREIEAVAGQWQVKYVVTTGELNVDLIAVGIVEITRTI